MLQFHAWHSFSYPKNGAWNHPKISTVCSNSGSLAHICCNKAEDTTKSLPKTSPTKNTLEQKTKQQQQQQQNTKSLPKNKHIGTIMNNTNKNDVNHANTDTTWYKCVSENLKVEHGRSGLLTDVLPAYIDCWPIFTSYTASSEKNYDWKGHFGRLCMTRLVTWCCHFSAHSSFSYFKQPLNQLGYIKIKPSQPYKNYQKLVRSERSPPGWRSVSRGHRPPYATDAAAPPSCGCWGRSDETSNSSRQKRVVDETKMCNTCVYLEDV